MTCSKVKTDKETMAEIPLPEPTVPTVLSGALYHSVEAPCTKECFLLGNPLSIASVFIWYLFTPHTQIYFRELSGAKTT